MEHYYINAKSAVDVSLKEIETALAEFKIIDIYRINEKCFDLYLEAQEALKIVSKNPMINGRRMYFRDSKHIV